MEEFTIVVILGVVFMGIFTGFILLNRQNPVKKARKRNEISQFDNLTEYREVEKATILDILKQKDNQIKSLNARIKQFEPIDEEDQPQKQVSFEEITALVKQTYPKYLPIVQLGKKQIMEMTKGMSMDEILNYVKQFTGNQQSQASPIQQYDSAGYRVDWA